MKVYPGSPGARPYNNFSPVERAIAGRVIRAAIARGEIVPSRTCSVCAVTFPHAVAQHLENYRAPLGFYSICGRCHAMLHLRFWRPKHWLAHISGLDPGKWFHQLRIDPETLTRPFDESYPNWREGQDAR